MLINIMNIRLPWAAHGNGQAARILGSSQKILASSQLDDLLEVDSYPSLGISGPS